MKNISIVVLLVFYFTTVAYSKEPILFPISNIQVKSDSLSKIELKRLFTLESNRWPDGTKVRILLLKRPNEYEFFLKTYLGLTPARYNDIINKKIASGRGEVPISVKTNLEMVTAVSEIPGSLGYIGEKRFIVYFESELKVLTIKEEVKK